MLTMDDKYRLSDFGMIPLQEHDHPLTAEIERKKMYIPGKVGAWEFGTETREKPFSLPIGIVEYNQLEKQRKLNSFVAFLFDAFGKPREIKIVYDYEPDKFYMVKVAEMLDVSRLVNAAEFELPLVANDPRKYSNVFADEVTWGSEVITFEYNYLLGREGLGSSVEVTSPQTLNIDVDGLAVQPIFEINGTANGLTISANEYSFTLPNFTNTDWVIDFENYTVHKNGIETMLDIREFYLLPGNNTVKITGSNINLDMRIKFRDKYM